MKRDETHPGEELRAIGRQRAWIVITSALALAVWVAALVQGPPSAAVIVTLLIGVALKKAAVTYRALGERREGLLAEPGSG